MPSAAVCYELTRLIGIQRLDKIVINWKVKRFLYTNITYRGTAADGGEEIGFTPFSGTLKILILKIRESQEGVYSPD